MTNRSPAPRKRLGQHWLHDARAAGAIIEALAPSPDDLVLEIGPGTGVLTSRLLDSGARVVAVEKDDRLAERLGEEYGDRPGFELIGADVLDVSLEEVVGRHGEERALVIGNIPYNVTSPILFWLLEGRRRIRRAVLTIQREVADRLVASPGSKTYGSITLALRQHLVVERIRQIRPGAFHPPPKVDSTVIRLVPRDRPAVSVPDEVLLEGIIRRGFGQRRKMLRTSLRGAGDWSEETLAAAAARAGVPLTNRPEALSLDEFGALARELSLLGARAPAVVNGEWP